MDSAIASRIEVHVASDGRGPAMPNPFFDHPILNSPYTCPARHWELDAQGQPTQQVIDSRRKAEFITPIPKPKKRKGTSHQPMLVFNEGKGLSTQEQQYDATSLINEVRAQVDRWRAWPNPNDWQVTPETARLLQHWRHHAFSNFRPFFCRVGESRLCLVGIRRSNRSKAILKEARAKR